MGDHARERSGSGSRTSGTSGTTQQEPAVEQERGNAAAQDELRQLTTGIDAAAVELSGGEPTHSGSVTATDAGEGRVGIEAPRIDFRATASLVDGVQLPGDATVQFGLTQTILGSERELIYERDGEEVLRKQIATPESRDAMWEETEDGGRRAQAPEPFYNVPTTLTEMRRSAESATYDQPGLDTPAREGGARLVRMEGQDRFISGWAVKRDGQVAQLGSYAWSIPWDVDIDEDLTGTGGEIEHRDSDRAPPTLDGEIAVNTNEEWMEIPSVEAAMNLGVGVLFRAIAQAEGRDDDTVAHAREALRRRDPTLRLTLTVVDTAEWFSADDIAITVTGSSTAATPVQHLNDGDSGTFEVRMSQVLDASSVGPGARLDFSAADTGMVSNDPATLHWSFPFPDASGGYDMNAPEGTEYTLAAEWSG